jgi:hypothetical protein
MELLIKIILSLIAFITGLVFLLQLLNMVIVLWRGRGNAEINIINAAIAAASLYILAHL